MQIYYFLMGSFNNKKIISSKTGCQYFTKCILLDISNWNFVNIFSSMSTELREELFHREWEHLPRRSRTSHSRKVIRATTTHSPLVLQKARSGSSWSSRLASWMIAKCNFLHLFGRQGQAKSSSFLATKIVEKIISQLYVSMRELSIQSGLYVCDNWFQTFHITISKTSLNDCSTVAVFPEIKYFLNASLTRLIFTQLWGRVHNRFKKNRFSKIYFF